jgi:hypothetical protein
VSIITKEEGKMKTVNCHKFCLIFLSIFLLNSCATPSKVTPESLKSLAPNEGIAIGSLIIRGGDEIFGTTEWELIAKNDNDTGMFPNEYSVIANRDGEEEIFALTMPAGEYTFFVLSKTGLSNFKAKMNLPFTVQPNKPVYIGRIIIEFPPGYINVTTNIRYKVDDAKDDITEKVKSLYDVSLTKTDSSIAGSGSTRPTTDVPGTATDSVLQADITRKLFAEESKLHKECEHDVLKAEPYRQNDRSIISAEMGGKAQELEKRLRAKGDMLVEKWFLQSCDAMNVYEVLLLRSGTGTDIMVKKLDSEK